MHMVCSYAILMQLKVMRRSCGVLLFFTLDEDVTYGVGVFFIFFLNCSVMAHRGVTSDLYTNVMCRIYRFCTCVFGLIWSNVTLLCVIEYALASRWSFYTYRCVTAGSVDPQHTLRKHKKYDMVFLWFFWYWRSLVVHFQSTLNRLLSMS